MSPFLFIVILFIILGLYLITSYNGLVRRRNRVREAWADIDVQLKRRHNLIPE